jgi:hypothetical protein
LSPDDRASTVSLASADGFKRDAPLMKCHVSGHLLACFCAAKLDDSIIAGRWAANSWLSFEVGSCLSAFRRACYFYCRVVAKDMNSYFSAFVFAQRDSASQMRDWCRSAEIAAL